METKEFVVTVRRRQFDEIAYRMISENEIYGIIDFSRTRHFNCGDSRYGWRKSRASIGNARNRTPRTLPQRVASRTQHHLAFHRQA